MNVTVLDLSRSRHLCITLKAEFCCPINGEFKLADIMNIEENWQEYATDKIKIRIPDTSNHGKDYYFCANIKLEHAFHGHNNQCPN